MLTESGRTTLTDKKIEKDVSFGDMRNRLFVRLVAKDRRIANVRFEYCIFDNCYMRNCVFDSCNFTGCKFVNSNLHGSSFPGCKFDYAYFEKTQIDNDLLDTSCPVHENLKMRFARSLRVNYQQIGDASSANKAISIELEATEVFLKKAWKANDTYHRQKYQGLDRFKMFLKWSGFKVLDFIWGNGESTAKLLRTVFLLLVGICLIDFIIFKHCSGDLLQDFGNAPKLFFGMASENIYPTGYLTLVTIIRLIMFGFFMSIIIKRFNRR